MTGYIKKNEENMTDKDKEIERLKLNIQEDSAMFQKEIKELKAQIEKLKAELTNEMVK